MTIKFPNGTRVEAVILAHGEKSMRVAVQDSDDALVLKSLNGTWSTEELEPVEVRFSWEQDLLAVSVSIEDCICSKELADRLVHLLVTGKNENPGASAVGSECEERALSASMVLM